MPKLLSLAIAGLSLAALAACDAPRYEEAAYTPREIYRAYDAEPVRVVRATPMVIEGRRESGAIPGAIVGALVGSAFGGGAGKIATVIGGGLIGGAVGSEISRRSERTYTTEYVLERDDGTRVTVVQADPQAFVPGQVVVLETGPDGFARVRRYQG